jgi:hypothetical protein
VFDLPFFDARCDGQADQEGGRDMIRRPVRIFIAGCLVLAIAAGFAKAHQTRPAYYRSVKVDGLSIFYRQAGPANAPTLPLLHGFPSLSRMYVQLFARLGGQFDLLAPDYPGFDYSDAPALTAFAYTFNHIAERGKREPARTQARREDGADA